MSRTTPGGLVVLAGLIAATVMGAWAQTRAVPKRRADPETAVISGRVLDGVTGQPVAGAVVTEAGRFEGWFFNPASGGPPRVSVMTRADGRFTFRNVRAGSHAVQASKPGYIHGAYGQRRPGGSSRSVELDPEEQVSITISLWRVAAITGTIVDEAGEPVVGQQVRAFRRVLAGGRRQLRVAGANWTDDRGIYRIHTLAPGTYFVTPAITQHAAPASLTDASDPPPAGTAVVRIGSAVHVIDADSPVPPVVPRGDQLLVYPRLFYPGVPTAAEATPIVVGAGEERANVDFQFLPIPAASVSGRAFEALPGARVTLRLFEAGASDASDMVVAEALSDASGAFVFPAVPPGGYVLKAVSSEERDNRWATLAFSLDQRGVSGLDFVLRPGLRITGRVEFDGNPQMVARDLKVALDAADGSDVSIELAPVTPAGRFNIDRLPGGDYSLRVGGIPNGWTLRSISHEGRDLIDAPLALAGDATDVVITLTNRMTEVHGTARSGSGLPDPDAVIVVFPADRDAWRGAGPSPPRVRQVLPDVAGEFRVEGLPPGDYYIVSVPAKDLDEGSPTLFADLARGADVVRLEEGVKKELLLQTRAIARR